MSQGALAVPGRWLAGVLLLASLAACSSEAAGDSCLEREAAGYLGMEKAAAKALRGTDFTMRRVGQCADSGQPWTTLEARVRGWTYRKQALRHLERHGWVKEQNAYVSPDGDYRATALPDREVGEGAGEFVQVTFVEIADEAEWARGLEEAEQGD